MAALYRAESGFGGDVVGLEPGPQHGGDRGAYGAGGVPAPKQIVAQTGRRPMRPRATQRGEPAPGRLEGALALRHLGEGRFDGGRHERGGDPLGAKLLGEAKTADTPAAGSGLSPPPGEGIVVHVALALQL